MFGVAVVTSFGLIQQVDDTLCRWDNTVVDLLRKLGLVCRVGFLPTETCFCQTYGLNQHKVVKTESHYDRMV